MNVLIVEDSLPYQTLLRLVVNAIEDATINDVVGSVREAVNAIRRQVPDVILLDIQLEDGNGMEVLDAMREHGIQAHVAVVSMLDEDMYRRTYLAAGAEAYFSKRASHDSLKAWLRRLQSQTPHAASLVHKGSP